MKHSVDWIREHAEEICGFSILKESSFDPEERYFVYALGFDTKTDDWSFGSFAVIDPSANPEFMKKKFSFEELAKLDVDFYKDVLLKDETKTDKQGTRDRLQPEYVTNPAMFQGFVKGAVGFCPKCGSPMELGFQDRLVPICPKCYKTVGSIAKNSVGPEDKVNPSATNTSGV